MENNQVEHPSHYTSGGIEVLDVLKAKMSREAFVGFCLGNVLKYCMRAGKKLHNDAAQDFKKAKFYLNEIVATLEE